MRQQGSSMAAAEIQGGKQHRTVFDAAVALCTTSIAALTPRTPPCLCNHCRLPFPYINAVRPHFLLQAPHDGAKLDGVDTNVAASAPLRLMRGRFSPSLASPRSTASDAPTPP